MRNKILSLLKRLARKIKNTVVSAPQDADQSTVANPAPPPQPDPVSPPQPVAPPATEAKTTAPEEPKIAETSTPQPQVASDIEVEPIETPNPNAYKFKVNTKVSTVSFSVASLQEATDNPLAQALIEVESISSIFGVHDFVTVTKKNNGDWDLLIPQIIDILQKNLQK